MYTHTRVHTHTHTHTQSCTHTHACTHTANTPPHTHTHTKHINWIHINKWWLISSFFKSGQSTAELEDLRPMPMRVVCKFLPAVYSTEVHLSFGIIWLRSWKVEVSRPLREGWEGGVNRSTQRKTPTASQKIGITYFRWTFTTVDGRWTLTLWQFSFFLSAFLHRMG